MFRSLPALSAALAAAVIAWYFSGIPLRIVVRRLLPLNLLFLGLFIFLPPTAPGRPAMIVGTFNLSCEGLLLASVIALKGNAIVLMLIGLLGSMDSTVLGHALSHLRIPSKLVLLMLMTVRYLEVLRRENSRLRAAMKVRAFRPRMNRHTYRTVGYLVGMLLVRCLDRSERISAAMKCRGFAGRFYLLEHFAFTIKDLPFCAAALVVFILLAWIELCPMA
jgi:cobalt/nickel transport system permease protein